MHLEHYTPVSFPVIEDWWRVHHGNDFRPGFISRSAFLVIGDDGEPAAFFCMHPMDCDFCYLGFPLVNPYLPQKTRDFAVDFMIESAKLWTTAAQFPILWISIRGEKILSRLRDKGFVEGESGNTHMFCKVGEIK